MNDGLERGSIDDGSFKIRACEICGRGGMRETSAIPAIRSRTRYKGMVPRTIQ